MGQDMLDFDDIDNLLATPVDTVGRKQPSRLSGDDDWLDADEGVLQRHRESSVNRGKSLIIRN